MILTLVLVSLLRMSSSANAQAGNEDYEGSDPWKTPLQELESITPECVLKIPDFDQIAFRAEVFLFL